MHYCNPRILTVHSDTVSSIAHFALLEDMAWSDNLAIHGLSFTDLIVDYQQSALFKSFTPLITRLCREMVVEAAHYGNVDVVLSSLLDMFGFTKALIEGYSVSS